MYYVLYTVSGILYNCYFQGFDTDKLQSKSYYINSLLLLLLLGFVYLNFKYSLKHS